MKCPYCGNADSNVLDSRPVRDGAVIRRRRQCASCSQRFTTFEEIEEKQMMVVKKDGTREPFRREKVLQGIITACRKRPVTTEQMENAVSNIQKAVWNKSDNEISSNEIGELVMEQLLGIDPVAYVRFASVYKQFEDAEQFNEVVESLRRRHKNKKNEDS